VLEFRRVIVEESISRVLGQEVLLLCSDGVKTNLRSFTCHLYSVLYKFLLFTNREDDEDYQARDRDRIDSHDRSTNFEHRLCVVIFVLLL
jgi:hypothetical protein